MTLPQKSPFALFYERLYVVLIVTATAVAAAWLVSRSITPVYRSQMKFYRPSGQDVFSLQQEGAGLPSGPRLPTASEELQASLLGLLRSANLRDLVAAELPERSPAYLQNNVQIDVDKFNLLIITAWDTDPVSAAEIARKYYEVFERQLKATHDRDLSRKLAVLDGNIVESTEHLVRDQDARLEFMRGLALVDYNTEFQNLSSTIGSLRKEIQDLEVRKATIDVEIAELERQMGLRPDWQDGSRVEVRNPRWVELTNRIDNLEQDLQVKLLEFQEAHPEILKIRTEIVAASLERAALEERIWSSLTQTTDPIRERLENDMINLITERAGLDSKILARSEKLAEQLGNWRSMPEYGNRLELMNQEIQKRKQTLDLLQQRREELLLQRATVAAFLEITEVAQVPNRPAYPKTNLNMAVAGVLGFVASVTILVVMARVRMLREEMVW